MGFEVSVCFHDFECGFFGSNRTNLFPFSFLEQKWTGNDFLFHNPQVSSGISYAKAAHGRLRNDNGRTILQWHGQRMNTE